jgi:hypothetical protein
MSVIAKPQDFRAVNNRLVRTTSNAVVATNASMMAASVVMTNSEPFWPQQRVGQVEQQAERDEAGKREIKDHGALL